jgi:[methyl-Co(III) methanol-specific corrinoid protein]:coenzyme M methyltransferase
MKPVSEKVTAMNSRERVLSLFAGKTVDVLPVINPTSVVTVECMRAMDTSFPKAHTDVNEMVNLSMTSKKLLGFDSVMPYFSVHIEAAALGCNVWWGDNNGMPVITKNAIRKIEDFEFPQNFLLQPACKNLLKAIRILRKNVSNDAVVIGKVVGPWTLAYHLYGIDNLILDIILEPNRIINLINTLLPVSISFAKAQFDAGADLLTWAEHVTSDLISAEIYREFMLPVHKRATAALRNYGPTILHVCGNIMDRLDYICQTGFSAIHFDSRNDLNKVIEIAARRIILVAGVNNPQTLSGGSKSDVHIEVMQKLNLGYKLIAPECAIPFNVPNSNLIELANTIHRAAMM